MYTSEYCDSYIKHIVETFIPLTVDALLWCLGNVSLCRKLGASWRTKCLRMGAATLTYYSGSTLQHGIHWLGMRRREGRLFSISLFGGNYTNDSAKVLNSTFTYLLILLLLSA